MSARAPRLAAATFVLGTTVLGALGGCDPELPDVPYACGETGLCPDGFTCRATVCVRDGAVPAESRAMRVSWINAAEMYWFDAPDGGADLLVVDGFTAGARALYELHVSPDGVVDGPAVLLDFPEEYPTSTAVVALDAGHYGVLTMQFPPVSSNDQVLSFYSLSRGTLTDQSSTPPIATKTIRYLGGAEPAYVGAVRREGGSVDVAYGDPNEGGSVEFARVTDGAWADRFSLPLPPEVPPLSADCKLWDAGNGVLLRVGLETPLLYFVPDAATDVGDVQGPLPVPGLPVYGFQDAVVALTPEGDGAVKYTLVDYDGAPIGPAIEGVTQESLEPHTGWPSQGGAAIAPVSSDPGFTRMGVAFATPTGLSTVGAFDRQGTDDLYSARALVRDGRVYLAWTSFHDALMDLWVATFPAEGS